MAYSCELHFLIQHASGSGSFWLIAWLFLAFVTASLSVLALLSVLHETKFHTHYHYLQVSLFSSHLITGLVVLPMLSFVKHTTLPKCTHNTILTIAAAMTHTCSVLSVMVVSWYLRKKTTSKTVRLPKGKTFLQQLTLFIWVVSLFASILPVFLPVHLFLMPMLIIALMVTTCKQVRVIFCTRRRRVSSINNEDILHLRIKKGIHKLSAIVTGFLIINVVCTMFPYMALILNQTALKDQESFQNYADFASKLPFLKSLMESLGYFWMQKTSRRRVYQQLRQQIAMGLQMLSCQQMSVPCGFLL